LASAVGQHFVIGELRQYLNWPRIPSARVLSVISPRHWGKTVSSAASGGYREQRLLAVSTQLRFIFGPESKRQRGGPSKCNSKQESICVSYPSQFSRHTGSFFRA